MQTFTQTFAGVSTWEINLPGKFFTVINCNNPVNIRLYSQGKSLDLGEIKGIGAGIEIGGMVEGVSFDRIQLDTTAADTVTIAIGNGQSRYNRTGQTKVAQVVPTNTAKTVTNASAQLVAQNTTRQYMLIQNKDVTGSIYVNFGAGAATTSNGVQIAPGGSYEMDTVVPTTAIQAIGSIANNANIVVVEG